jgi:hypothetical protein
VGGQVGDCERVGGDFCELSLGYLTSFILGLSNEFSLSYFTSFILGFVQEVISLLFGEFYSLWYFTSFSLGFGEFTLERASSR